MKYFSNPIQITISLTIVILFISCEKIEIEVAENQCTINASENHPFEYRYQYIINDYIDAGVPGVSVTVISPEGVWSGNGGKSDLANQKDLTSCNVMRIASATKVFTATTILKLHEQGIINIDDKINKYIPKSITDEIENANTATIRQLLNHTSGIKDYLSVNTVLDILNLSIKNYSASENLKLIYGKSSDFGVGSDFKYSNSNYLLLGMVLKYATGESAYETVWNNIIDPISLKNTYQGNNIPKHLSRGYYDTYDNNYMKDLTEIDNNAISGNDMLDGGLISNSYDMATFLHSLFSEQIISDESLTLMKTFINVSPTGNRDLVSGYGLGLWRIETTQGAGIGHYGSIYCFNSLYFHFPDHNTTIAVTLNGYSSNIGEVHYGEKIFEYLFND
jgi:D-alanyl-D-alanine carboxypeptidase